MHKLTIEHVVSAIEAKAENGIITGEALRGVTTDLYGTVLSQAEEDAAHDAALIAEIRKLQGQYPVMTSAGKAPADLAAIIHQRHQAIADHEAAVNQDMAQKQAWRGAIFGSFEAAATVAMGGGTPVAVGTALLPALNALREIATALGITVVE
jgi:hypothetical protein